MAEEAAQAAAAKEEEPAVAATAEAQEPANAEPAAPPSPRLSKQEQKASSQRLHASGKRQRPKSAPSPGPGAHNPEPVNKYRAPGYSFGKTASKGAWAPTGPKPTLEEPGPGAYACLLYTSPSPRDS